MWIYTNHLSCCNHEIIYDTLGVGTMLAFAKAIVALQFPMLKPPTASLYPCHNFSSGDNDAAVPGPRTPLLSSSA